MPFKLSLNNSERAVHILSVHQFIEIHHTIFDFIARSSIISTGTALMMMMHQSRYRAKSKAIFQYLSLAVAIIASNEILLISMYHRMSNKVLRFIHGTVSKM